MSDIGNKKVFSDNLKKYMNDRELTRSDIANITGSPYSTVNDWWNGKTYPRIDMIEKLAKYFNVSKSALIEKNGDIIDGKKKYLMDRIAKADDKKLAKFEKLMEIIDDEEGHLF